MTTLVPQLNPWLCTLPTLTQPQSPEKHLGIMFFFGLAVGVCILLCDDSEAMGRRFGSLLVSILSTFLRFEHRS